jgi:uncharacterized protein YjdB
MRAPTFWAPRVLALATTLQAITTSCASEQARLATPPVEGGATVAAITVVLPAAILNTGDGANASAIVRDAQGQTLNGRQVSWSATNSAVAAVNASTGHIVARSEGTTEIVATSEGVSGRAPLEIHGVVTSIAVTLTDNSVYAGETVAAVATPRDINGNALQGRALGWSSSSPATASVGADGAVAALADGSAMIRATSEGVTGEALLTVSRVPVASATVNLASPSITAGSSTSATVVLRDASGATLTGRSVSWSSRSPTVATVDAVTGTVTGIAAGTTAIVATSEGISGEAPVTVTAAPVAPVASVTVTIADASLSVGQQTTAAAVPRDAANNVLTGRSVVWTSSNSAVATVSAVGSVTAVSAGTVNIIATIEGVVGQGSVVVSVAPVASVSVSLADASLQVGQTTAASAVTRDAAGGTLTGRAIAWSSSNTTVASVSASGVVTALAPGTANVIATSEGITGQTSVTVSNVPVAVVSVSLADASLDVGAITTASAVTRDASGAILTGRAIAWSSANASVATVNANGRVTAVGPGSTNIRATSEGVTGQAAVTVTAVTTPVATVTVTVASSIDVGQTTAATAVLRDAGGNVLNGRAVSWTSNNTAVATVSASGSVTGRTVGSADITATSEGVSGSSTIDVTAAPPPPPTTLLFASDWSTALGTSGNAILDGGTWDNTIDGGGPANRLEVISPAGLDFPADMTGVLKVLHRNNNSEYWNVNSVGAWTLPPVGGSLYFRLYFRHDVAGSGGSMLHTVQTGPPGNCPYTAELQFQKVSETQIDFVISHYGGSSSSSNAHDWTVRLNKNQTYRVEEQYTRMGTNSWKVHARVYDSNDILIKDDADFVDEYTGQTMASWTGTITSATDCLRNKMIGNPGDGNGRGSTDTAHQQIYYGGFAVSHTGWIGPYVRGEKP